METPVGPPFDARLVEDADGNPVEESKVDALSEPELEALLDTEEVMVGVFREVEALEVAEGRVLLVEAILAPENVTYGRPLED